MSDAHAAVPLAKWPFYLADLALSAIVVYIIWRLGPIEGTTDVIISIGCVFAAAWAAWISITPWLTEHRTSAQLTESTNLRSSLEQIQSVEKVADLIRQANSQWQNVQDAAGRTVTSAKEISERMKAETDEFMRFLDNANNSERAGLRLEVEKLRRMEGEWIKVTVQILDHVFAVTRAAERSGQPQLMGQMQQFQNACRDVARRIGLTPFMPAMGDAFDARTHQLPDPKFTPPGDAKIGDVLATGYTYQGQVLRRSLVMLAGEGPEPEESVEGPVAEIAQAAAASEQRSQSAAPAAPSEEEARSPKAAVTSEKKSGQEELPLR
jgi:molecular chaperone GrpE (heat shock protein)